MVKETATQRKRRLEKAKKKRQEKLLQESAAEKATRLAKRRKLDAEYRKKIQHESPDKVAKWAERRKLRLKKKKEEEHRLLKEHKKKKLKEEDETYIPTWDSSDSEDDYIIQSGGFREDLLINSESPDSQLRFSNQQKLLFEEQMRMCVQLTTQAFLMSFDLSTCGSLNFLAKKYLLKMASLASSQSHTGKKSSFESANLADALAIVRHFDHRKPRSDKLRTETSCEVKRVLCESKVFMYPDLCPESFFSSSECMKKLKFKKYRSEMIEFDKAEDNLIVLGLETFGFNAMKIMRYYLPCRNKWEIQERIKSAHSTPRSIIKRFKKHWEVPEFHIEIRPFDEKNIKAPIEQDIKDLPNWMEPFVDLFERDGPYPYFLETESGVVVKDNFKITDKSLCNDLKLKEEFKPHNSKKFHRKYNPENIINEEIDLCLEFCDPTLVNSNFTEFANDLDLEINMSGGIKLSALKKSKPSFFPHSVNKQCRSGANITASLNPISSKAAKLGMSNISENLQIKSEDLSSKLSSSCNSNHELEVQMERSTSEPEFSYEQVSSRIHFKNEIDVHYTNAEKSHLLSNENACFKNVAIKLENDAILLQNSSECMKSEQNDSHFAASNNQIFPTIKIKEEPL